MPDALLPIAARSRLVSRTGLDVLDLKLSPWLHQPFDDQNDVGIDGDVKLTEDDSSTLNPRVLGTTFQYQLKSTELRPGVRYGVSIRPATMRLWLRMNVPVFVFLAVVDLGAMTGELYWRCVDGDLETEIAPAPTRTPGPGTVRVRFGPVDRFDRTDRREFVRRIHARTAAISGPKQ